MPSKSESVVYFDEDVKAEKLLKFVEESKGQFSIMHCLVAATGLTFLKYPKMNRFVTGHRLYQRREAAITFSMKRKKLDKKAKSNSRR